MKLDANYWNERYSKQQTGWDIGSISTPLKAYFEQLSNKNMSILIPGCGNAHEANYLAELGFQDITLVDYAPLLVEQLKEKFAQKTAIKVIESDFFELNGQYDLIVEQTFFCAISPTLRQQYAKKMYDLLKPQAKLVGLLFNRSFEQQGPPFGGCAEEYLAYFTPYFHIKTFENSYNSISPRANTEIFMILQRKSETQQK